MPNGGSVTAGSESGLDDEPALVSFLGVKPLDTLTVGVFPEEDAELENGDMCDLTVALPEERHRIADLEHRGRQQRSFSFLGGIGDIDGGSNYFIGPSGDIGPSGEVFDIAAYTTTNAAFAVARDADGNNPTSYTVVQGATGDGEDECPDGETPIQLPDYDTWTPITQLGAFTVTDLQTTETGGEDATEFQWAYTDSAGLDYPEVEAPTTPYTNGGSASVQTFAPLNSNGTFVATFETFAAAQETKVDLNETIYSRRTSIIDSSDTVSFNSTLPYLGGIGADFSQDPDGNLPVISWQTSRAATMDGQIAEFGWSDSETEWDVVTPQTTTLNFPALLPDDGVALLPTNDATQNPIRSQFVDFLEGLNSETNLRIGILSLSSTEVGSYDALRQGFPNVLLTYTDTPPDSTSLIEFFEAGEGEQVGTSARKLSLAKRLHATKTHPVSGRHVTGRVVHAVPASTFDR